MKYAVKILILLSLLLPASLLSQHTQGTETQKDAKESEAAKLARETSNPIASIISLPVQFNFNFGAGDHNRFQSVTNVMPVLPFKLNKKINVVNRVIIPFIYQPDVAQESGGSFGVGDLNYSAFFTPAKTGKFIWGIGPAMNIPTRSNDVLGSPEFGIGPTAIALVMAGNWTYGFTANNVWSYEGGNLNQLFSQVFVVYTFPSAWFVQFMPTITANWNAPEGEQWSIPLGANMGKVVMFGKQPVKLIGGGGYFVESPTNGPEWQLFFQTVFLFPKGKK